MHSDPFRTARLVPATRDRTAYLDSHITLLNSAAEERGLWAPSFNYDFPRTHTFDVKNDPCQLGPLPERFRETLAGWRTPVPMFAVAGTGTQPDVAWGPDTDPFGEESLFAELVRLDGVILYYGDTFHYNTIIHFAERMSGGPMYRYDKIFRGDVILDNGDRVTGSLNYHVRPLGTGLDYDWPRLLGEAESAGVCVRSSALPQVLAASAGALVDFFLASMRRDPFSLLDAKSSAWVIPAFEDAGRRFSIGDFESPVSWGEP